MKVILVLAAVFLSACTADLPLFPDLKVDLNKFQNSVEKIDDSIIQKMEGVYYVAEGREVFGELVVVKWVNNRLCIYARDEVVFSENACGSKNNTILMSGYYRIVRTGEGSKLDLKISEANGSSDLLNGKVPASIIISGETANGKKINIQRLRDINRIPFYILAHRCGGRNSERLGVSENSLEMIKLAPVLGANGIELDVQKTKDGRLIVFHDDNFSPRTVQGVYLLGAVNNYTLDQIKLFGRLIYGEQIPTLEEALNTILDSTPLKLVWIDIKDPGTVDSVLSIQERVQAKSNNIGRGLTILAGFPSKETLDAYKRIQCPAIDSILIEYSYDEVMKNDKCKVWAPRWTLDIPSEKIKTMNDNKKLVFTWTLDFINYIEEFTKRKKIDGILSDYPELVAAVYYSE